MGSNFPRDHADEALLSFIHDFLRKRGLYKSAMAFKEEIEASMEGEVQLQPAVDSREGFLYEWFGVFWDVFTIRFKSEVSGDKKSNEKAAANSGDQPPGNLQQPQQQQLPQHAQQLQAQQQQIPQHQQHAQQLQQKQQLQQPQLQQLQQLQQQQKQQPSQPGQHGQRSSQDFGKQNKKSASLGRDVLNRRNDMMKLDSAGGRMEHRGFNGGQGSLSAGRQDTGSMGAPVGSVGGDHDLMGANSVGLNPKMAPPGRASNASSGHGSQDRRNAMMAEDESVSERSAQALQRQKSGDPSFDGGLPLTEGSAGAQRGAKKRTSGNKDKQAFKKGAGRNAAAAAAVSSMAPGNSKPGRRPGSAADVENLRQFPNAYTAAAHAAARAAAEVGEELPRDAKPVKMTTQGLFYWHENEYRVWPGGIPAPSLPNDLGQEQPPDAMYRKTQQWSNDRKQQWRNPAAEKAAGKRTREDDVGLPRSTTDSVSSKSAFAQGRAAMPRNMMMSESVESGGVADNAPGMGRGKPAGNKKKGPGGGSQAWDGGLGDVAGTNAVPEHARPRGKQAGVRRGTGSQNTSADGLDGSRGQNKGQMDTQTMSGVGPDPSNGAGRVNPGEDLLFNYGNAMSAGRNAAYSQNPEGSATLLQSMGFDPKSMKKNGPDDDARVLEHFFPTTSVEDSMQIIGGYADSQTYKSDEISTIPRRNQ